MKFGEVYFSVAYPGRHHRLHMTVRKQTLSVSTRSFSGYDTKSRLVDERKRFGSKGELMDAVRRRKDNYQLVRIPVGVVNGYKTIA
jgi:hypothetical protein